MNTSPDLFKMKRDLERAVELVTHYAFNVPALKAKYSNAQGYFAGPVDDARYFHAMLNQAPELGGAQHPEFLVRVAAARAKYAEVEKAVAADKARLAQKRIDRAARETQKQHLGVDIKKVDERATVGTFQKVLAQLEPLRKSIAERLRGQLDRSAKAQLRLVNDAKLRSRSRIDWGFFSTVDPRGSSCDGWKLRDDIDEFLLGKAESLSREIVAEFAAKLAGKIDRERAPSASVVSVSVSSPDFWSHSIAKVVLSDGSAQVWETHVILNRSCLGKVFNQWPTRRVS